MLRDDGVGRRELAADLHIDVDELDRLVFGLCTIAMSGGGSSSQRTRTHLHVVP
jgi:hypothetical protein